MKRKGCHELTWQGRLVLEKMLKQKAGKAQIAEYLGVCRRTVYNEIRRGKTMQLTKEYEFVEVYCPETAERRYQQGLAARGIDLKIGKDIALANYIEEKIVEGKYSPAGGPCWC